MRIGVIGTNWGLMHVGAFRAAGAEVVALCGRDEEKTRTIAGREGIPLATTDVGRLCAEVDAVVVASPDTQHLAHVRAALDAGRDVLCEKPLAHSLEEAHAIAKRARTSSRRMSVCFPYRALPTFAALRTAAGGVRHVAVTVRNSFAAAEGRATSGPLVGASGDFGGMSHLVDAACWLMGDSPEWVQAALVGRPAHTSAVQVGFARGGLATITQIAASEPGIHGEWVVTGDDWEATLAGGYVPAIGGWRLSPVRLFERGTLRELAPGVEALPGGREPWAEAHVETARRFLAGNPLATLDDGVLVQGVLAAAAQSETKGRRVHL